ncbi:MAG TPA: DUF6624 domain-containing protein, partial [Longimicrobium sp.]|nr:DUF6624 domain-containing protein [Longimicrobium sp.]
PSPPAPTATSPAPAPALKVTPPEAGQLAKQAERKLKEKEPAAALALYQRAWDAGAREADVAYSAACAAVLANQRDEAFRWLDLALGAGFRDADWMKKDEDLVPLQADARFAKAVEQAIANGAREDAAIQQPRLAKEILAMAERDQQVRFKLLRNGPNMDPTVVEEMKAVDLEHTARMKEIIATHGWPGTRLVGRTASKRAWLLVQHADLNVEFQELCLAALEKAVAAGDADPKEWAYLHDRVQVNRKRPQRFGTQFYPVNGVQVPRPMEDPEHVDERRRSIGLGTMEEYARELSEMSRMPASPKQP